MMMNWMTKEALMVRESERDFLLPLPRKSSVCIAIPTFRGGHFLERLMEGLWSQKIDDYDFEVLVIDSGSEDGTDEIVRRYRHARCHTIDRKKFSHPATRNLAVSMTEADYIVFMTQDASPVNSMWLAELLRPFKHWTRVAATYSRQIPRPGCSPLESRDIQAGAPLADEIRYIDPSDTWQKHDYLRNIYYYMRFSNVSACYRRSLLVRHPFDERLKMVEDQAWTKSMIEQGHAVYYASKSMVFHSHHFGVRQTYARHFYYGASFRIIMAPEKCPGSWEVPFWNILQDYLYLLRLKGPWLWKIKWALKSILLRFNAFLGFRRGWQRG
jgi:rhamnosyltransferase